MHIIWNIDLVWLLGMIIIPPAILLTWIFGIRRFLAQNGRSCISAATWWLSMWADWTTSLEITKTTGRRCWSGWAFVALQIALISLFISMFIVLYRRT